MHRPWAERDTPPAPRTDDQRRRWLSAALAWPLAATLPGWGGCARAPRRVALLAGLTGSASDLGVAARDAASLAVADGAGALRVELQVFDDGQRPDRIDDVVARMASSQVEAVIGPMTSRMAETWIPHGERLGLVTVSPTVTSHDFAGRDDGFFRVCATTRAYARRSAEFALQSRGWRRFAVLRDDSNRAYTRSWTEFFVDTIRQAGADVAPPVVYERSRADMSDPLNGLASALATRPEVLVIVANAQDTARVAQAVAASPAPPALLAAEWAATDHMILAGGRAVEGLVVTQFFDRHSRAPAYLAFADRFSQRYGRLPGFAEVAAYDATQVVLQALAAQRRGETLKQTLLRLRRFEGLQNPIVFDDHGDCDRPLMVTEVRNGQYVVIG